MQRGTVINLGQFKNSINFFRKNWCILLLTLMFILGLIAGSVIFKRNDTVAEWTVSYAENFLNLRENGSFWAIFFNSFMVSFGYYLINSVLGTSIIGVTTVPFVISVRGGTLGCLMSAIFAKHSLKGIVINALAVVPSSAISVLFMLISAKEAMRFSSTVIKITMPNSQPRNLSPAFTCFLRKNSILIIPIVLSALLEAWLSAKTMSFI